MSTPDLDIDALIGGSPVPVNALVPVTEDLAMGAFDGADRYSAQLGLWAPIIRSADADILPDKDVVDGRTRDMLRNDAYVQGGANLHKDNIVGAHFLLNSRPATRVLFGDDDEAFEEAFQQEVEELWELWSDCPDNWVDASRANNFTSLIRLVVGIHLSGGEVLATAEWDRDSASVFNTCIQMIECERLSTAPLSRLDRSVRAGIRLNSRGAPLAYQIRTQHPNDINYFPTLPEWKEIPVRKPWGRLQVIHLKEQTRPDQTRGIAEMAAALKEMRMGHSLRDINLQHAVTQSLYAAAITSDLPRETVFQQLGGGEIDASAIEKLTTTYAEGYLNSVMKYAGKANGLTVDGVRIPHLYPGTKLELLSPGAGGTLGTQFEQSLLRYIAATLGVSYEQLSRDYTSTNYSSARAAMTETWKFMQARKKLIADQFATRVFRLWLEEAINKDLLTSFPAAKAPMLYTNGRLNHLFDALSRCEWIGASRGQIDEQKETDAAIARITAGLSTAEDELARLGKDWRKVFRQIKREQALREQLGLKLPGLEPKAAPAATGQQSADNPDDQEERKAA